MKLKSYLPNFIFNKFYFVGGGGGVPPVGGSSGVEFACVEHRLSR